MTERVNRVFLRFFGGLDFFFAHVSNARKVWEFSFFPRKVRPEIFEDDSLVTAAYSECSENILYVQNYRRRMLAGCACCLDEHHIGNMRRLDH